MKGRWMVRRAYHESPLSMSKGHPPLLPCGVTEYTPQGKPFPLPTGGQASKGEKILLENLFIFD